MAKTRSIGAVLESAEQAAAAGDHATAERWLREAVALQEGELGHLHPDLANTLNNLGVICERVGKLDDAEQCYRRAYGIAKRVLVPDHVFVITAEQNLRQFCAARGVPFAPATPPHGLARVGPEGQSDRSLESNFVSETTSAPVGAAPDRLVPDATPAAAARVPPAPAGPAPTTPAVPLTATPPASAKAQGEASAISGEGDASRKPVGSRTPAAASPIPSERPTATPSAATAAPAGSSPSRTPSPASAGSPPLAASPGGPAAPTSARRQAARPDLAAAAGANAAAGTSQPAATRAGGTAPPTETSSVPPRVAGRKYLLAFLMITVALVSVWLISRGDVPPETATSTRPAPAPPAAPLEPPAPVSEAAPRPAVPRQEAAASTRLVAPTASGDRNAPTVVRAAVCRQFATQGTPDWRCEPAGAEARQGALVFYTRIAAPRDTTMEHRWYHDDALEQRVELRIRASGTGYRTYSRRTARAGAWRVELRNASGELLHEERFVVR